jgi:EAL domain-containing protein (putative c-di-GMP-specific phosphodiesterase class I)
VLLAIDDFGTGYSSLSYLQHFPLDILKVDRQFVQALGVNAEGEEIVSAVIGLAHALGLQVVAEGVETTEQLRILRSLDCDLAQGYLFSRPLPATEIVTAFGLPISA